jgi:hypothetical protein
LAVGPRRVADAADVVQAGREGVPVPFECLRQTAELSVLLEHENAAAAFGERRSGGKATDARTNDYRIEGPFRTSWSLFDQGQ